MITELPAGLSQNCDIWLHFYLRNKEGRGNRRLLRIYLLRVFLSCLILSDHYIFHNFMNLYFIDFLFYNWIYLAVALLNLFKEYEESHQAGVGLRPN